MEIAIIAIVLFIPIFGAAYFRGGKGVLIAGAIGLSIVAAVVVFLFVGVMAEFIHGGIGYHIILAAYVGMIIAAATPVSYLFLWAIRKLPRQRI